MPNCIQCGKPLQPGTRFCPACGAQQPQQQPVYYAPPQQQPTTQQQPTVPPYYQPSPPGPFPPPYGGAPGQQPPYGAPQPVYAPAGYAAAPRKGMSAGAKAGIAVGVLLAAAAIVLLVLFTTGILGGSAQEEFVCVVCGETVQGEPTVVMGQKLCPDCARLYDLGLGALDDLGLGDLFGKVFFPWVSTD